MSDLYPTANQLGLKPTKPLPAPGRPARPAKPVKPAKGAQQKVQMKTPWDKTVTVPLDMKSDKLQRGYKYVKDKTNPPQGLNKPRPATKPSRGSTATKKASFNVFEKSPEGWEGTVKHMKNHPEVDNPFALANYMKDKGDTSHHFKSGKHKASYDKNEMVSLTELLQESSKRLVTRENFEEAMSNVMAGKSNFVIPSYTKVVYINAKTINAWRKIGKEVVKPEGNGWRIMSGKSSVFAFELLEISN